MATFYGNLKGSRGEATRCGTRNSGIMAAVRGFDGSLTVRMSDNGDRGGPFVVISSSSGSAVGGQILFSGSLEELRTILIDRHIA